MSWLQLRDPQCMQPSEAVWMEQGLAEGMGQLSKVGFLGASSSSRPRNRSGLWGWRGSRSPTSSQRVVARSASGNQQDAEESCPALEVPIWQMPSFEVTGREHMHTKGSATVLMIGAPDDFVSCIVANLPVMLQVRPEWHLGYCMATDGISLSTLYRNLEDAGPCILVIEEAGGSLFGAFIMEGLTPHGASNGSAELFLFRYSQTEGHVGHAAVYCWTQPDSTASMYCDHKGIVIGLDGPAIYVDEDLLRGTSAPSEAFASTRLTPEHDFVVRNLEVWHWVR